MATAASIFCPFTHTSPPQGLQFPEKAPNHWGQCVWRVAYRWEQQFIWALKRSDDLLGVCCSPLPLKAPKLHIKSSQEAASWAWKGGNLSKYVKPQLLFFQTHTHTHISTIMSAVSQLSFGKRSGFKIMTSASTFSKMYRLNVEPNKRSGNQTALCKWVKMYNSSHTLPYVTQPISTSTK